MSEKGQARALSRTRRQTRVRRRIRGTDERPRLSVYRSLRYTYAQLISDQGGVVLAAASTKSIEEGRPVDAAKTLGGKIAELAKQKNIESAVFDRNGYLYHGRVAAVAEGAREGGLKI